MQDIPEKRLSAIGRLPSDIDGDEPRHDCGHCGRSRFESDLRLRGESYLCEDCDDE